MQAQSAEECASTTHLLFPYRGVYVHHAGQVETVAEANQVVFFNESEPYRVSYPLEGGDASLSMKRSTSARPIPSAPPVTTTDAACDVHVFPGVDALRRRDRGPAGFTRPRGRGRRPRDNGRAEHYRTIIVYPAIKARESWWWDFPLGAEPNPLGCWDSSGYLDPGTGGDRYLTKDAPQIKVVERMIAELTEPVRDHK